MIDITQIDHGETPHYNRQRCEHVKPRSHYAHLAGIAERCKHTAVYTIEGEHLCERHAGRWLIAYHLHEAEDTTE